MERLPRGRHGLSPDYVARNQRERLLTAVAECVADVGYEATTVAMVSARASVSKSDYYQRFENKDDCFAAAYDDNMRMLRERISAACESNKDWPLRVRDGLAALLDFLEAEPDRARLLLVEGLRGGKQIYGIFLDSVQEYAERLGSGAPRPQAVAKIDESVARIDGLPSTISGAPSRPPSAAAASSAPAASSGLSGQAASNATAVSSAPRVIDEAVAGGVASLVSRRVRTQDEVSLADFLPELVEFALTPYVGAAEARRIGSQAMNGG